MEFVFDVVLPAPLAGVRAVVNYEEGRQAFGVSYIILFFLFGILRIWMFWCMTS